MRLGLSPADATRKVIERIAKYYPSFSGAVIAVTMSGEYGEHWMDKKNELEDAILSHFLRPCFHARLGWTFSHS